MAVGVVALIGIRYYNPRSSLSFIPLQIRKHGIHRFIFQHYIFQLSKHNVDVACCCPSVERRVAFFFHTLRGLAASHELQIGSNRQAGRRR